MKKIITFAVLVGAFTSFQSAYADQSCVPPNAVICSITEIAGYLSCDNKGKISVTAGGRFIVSTTVQEVNVYQYNEVVSPAEATCLQSYPGDVFSPSSGAIAAPVPSERANAHEKSLALANQLKAAGVCAYVLDTSN